LTLGSDNNVSPLLEVLTRARFSAAHWHDVKENDGISSESAGALDRSSDANSNSVQSVPLRFLEERAVDLLESITGA
jgi:hypothetical protein